MATPTTPGLLPNAFAGMRAQMQGGLQNPLPPVPVGQKTVSPQANIPKKPNVTPQPAGSQTANASNGLVGSADSINPYERVYGQLEDIGTQDSPEVTAAKDEITRYQNSYANASAGLGLGGADFNYTQGNEQNLANQYQQGLASRQAALSNALSAQGQRISALSGAGAVAKPYQQGYAILNPFNNAPVGSGGGGGTGNLNSLASWGAGIDYAASSTTKGKDNDTNIAAARDQGGVLQSQLNATPDYNANPVNLWNTVQQEIQSNVSNPKYPQIEATLRNVINNYASVLGEDPTTLLIQGAQAPSLLAFVKNLDDLASRKNAEVKSIGLGGTPPPAPSYTAPTPSPTGKIRVKIGNQTGTIDAADFDPKIMTKI